MENLIYYPSFIIRDEEWLKFALLYMDDISTIVPFDADVELTPLHNLIMSETNLLNLYRPTFDEIENATRGTLRFLEREIRNPINNYRGFSNGFNRPNDIEIWNTRENQNFELFRSKFSGELEYFLLDNGFSRETNNGILISEDIGYKYMSNLAKEISYSSGRSVVTDLKNHKSTKTIIRPHVPIKNRAIDEINSINGYIKLSIPLGIKDIPIEDLIDLRNSSRYQRKLAEFKKAFRKLTNEPGYELSEKTIYDIQENLYESKKGLMSELTTCGYAVIGTSIGISCALNNSIPLEQFREFLGILTVMESCRPIVNRLRANRERNSAASIITDINNLRRNKVYVLNKNI